MEQNWAGDEVNREANGLDALTLPKRFVPSMWFQCLLGRIQACRVDLLYCFKHGAGVTFAKPIMRMPRHHLIQVAFGYPFSPMNDSRKIT